MVDEQKETRGGGVLRPRHADRDATGARRRTAPARVSDNLWCSLEPFRNGAAVKADPQLQSMQLLRWVE
jgi:hypothetical protein